jgi:hypothetical protein
MPKPATDSPVPEGFAVSRLAFALMASAVVAGPAPADFGLGLFKRKAKAEPPKGKQHAATLSTSLDEAARKQAAEEMRGLDPRSNPDVFPALIGALQKDPSPAVRVAAAETLGKLRPVYQPAGIVLDTVAATDPAASVREAAQAALFQYHLGGYVTPTGPRTGGSAEPPLAAKPATRPGVLTFRPITNSVGRGTVFPATGEPPLAKKLGEKPAAKPAPAVPQPMPISAPPPVAVPSLPSGPLPAIGG